MFDPPEGTLDHTLERRREARRVEARAICVEKAQLDRRLTVISREAGDEGDWKAAGCSSGAQWLAQITSSEYRTALQIADAGEALRTLPALDEAFSTGAMTFDQTAAATRHATPETDAQLARIAIGKTPSEIARAARTLSPPTLADDAALRKRRALSMRWVEDGRELIIKGSLPLEQGAAFEQAIRTATEAQRALDKKHGAETLTWQQSSADALVALTTTSTSTSGGDGSGYRDGSNGGKSDPTSTNRSRIEGEGSVKRSNTTLIVHLSPDEPPFIEGAGPISPETADYLTCDARNLFLKPHGHDLLQSRAGRCASYAQLRALLKRSKHCQYPGCTTNHNLDAHHLTHYIHSRQTLLKDLSLLCTHHHKHVHDHHIHTTGTGQHPIFKDTTGRLITTTQPHAPPG